MVLIDKINVEKLKNIFIICQVNLEKFNFNNGLLKSKMVIKQINKVRVKRKILYL